MKQDKIDRKQQQKEYQERVRMKEEEDYERHRLELLEKLKGVDPEDLES